MISPSSNSVPDVRRCSYCSAPLNRQLYFCIRCGTPYCDPDAITGGPTFLPPSEGELIRAHAPGVWPLFWTVACVLFVGVVLQSTAFVTTKEAALLTRVLSVALAGVALVWGVFHRQALWVQLRRPGFLQWEGWAALGTLVILLPLNAALSELFYTLEPGRKEFFQEFFGSFSSGEIILYFCLLPAVAEEVLFRGLLQHWLQVAISPTKAIIYASALFALIHLSVVTAPYLFLLGLVLGWSKWRTGSLYPAIAIHFIHNYWVLL